MDNPSKEVERWRNTIADLNKKREAAEGRVEKLKGRKSPLTLRAHTGDEPSREKLCALNSKLLTECQESEDLQEAVRQAEIELAKAEDALAVEQEAERLRLLSALATDRIKSAAVVDQQARALAQALASYAGLGRPNLSSRRLSRCRLRRQNQKPRQGGRSDGHTFGGGFV